MKLESTPGCFLGFCLFLAVACALQASSASGHLSAMGGGTGEKLQARAGNGIWIRSIKENKSIDEDEGKRISTNHETADDGEDNLDSGDDDEEELVFEDYDDFEISYLAHANHANRSSNVISTRGRETCSANAQFIFRSHADFGVTKYPNDHVIRMYYYMSEDIGKIVVHCPFFRTEFSQWCTADRFTVFTGGRFRRGVRRCGLIHGFYKAYSRSIKIVFRTNSYKRKAGFDCTISCLPKVIPASFDTGCLGVPQPPEIPTDVTSCDDILPEFLGGCSCHTCPSSDRLELRCSVCSACDMEIFAAHRFLVTLGITFLFNDTCDDPINMGDLTYGNEDQFRVLLLCSPVPDRIIIPAWPSVHTIYYSSDCPAGLTGDPCHENTKKLRDSFNRVLEDQKAAKSRGRSQLKSFKYDDLSVLESFPGLESLYLLEVLMDTRRIPSLEHLHTLMIMDENAVIADGVFDFKNLASLKELVLVLGEKELHTNAIQLASPLLEYVQIQATKTAVESVEADFINITTPMRHIPELTMTVNSTLMPFVLYPVFKPLLKTAIIHWLNDDGTRVDCKHCGVAWFWKLSEDELACLQVQCTHPNGTIVMVSDFIHGGGTNPCSIYFG